jgi:hypothetical protein
MTKLLSTLVMVVVALAALALAGPALTRLINSLVPLVLVVGIVAAVLRLMWAYTRRW